MKTYEIERKFLLKNIPDLDYDQILRINQYYLPNDGEWTDRVRKMKDMYKGETTFIRTRKLKVGELSNEEDEHDISEDEFNYLIENSISYVDKIRRVKYIKGNKWEIDEFLNIQLILCELEMVVQGEMNWSDEEGIMGISIPEDIKEQVILESTNIPELSNKSISVSV